MFYSAEQIRRALIALDEARRIDFCDKPLRDKDGNEMHPKKIWLVSNRAGMRNREIPEHPYGVHGSSYLEIDPATQQLRCGACINPSIAVVAPPPDPPDQIQHNLTMKLMNRKEEAKE